MENALLPDIGPLPVPFHVVVGTTADHVLIADPAFDATPMAVTIGDFELAWLNSDNACVIVLKRS